MKLPKLAQVRKALVALAGAVAQVVALGVVHGQALHWATVVIAVATVLGVHQVPNGGTQ